MAYHLTEGALCVMLSHLHGAIPVVCLARNPEKQWLVAHARDNKRLFLCLPKHLRRINCDPGEIDAVELNALYSSGGEAP